MQAVPGRPNGWWISPALPTIANVLLAVLWLLSAFGGWGTTAFCGDPEQRDAVCADHYDVAVLISFLPALGAAALGVAAWTAPAIRRRPDRLDSVLAVSALLWVVAEAVLFVGGFLAKP
ncbi:hypothetical protein [Actinomadura kijaniata]|uniref:hypothetical protein n=1 Tax=Actinomadura kijaniata TaxID=46161 RepID=UPI0008295343|nr:hypothetical protein [Actinomadura kijaniata]